MMRNTLVLIAALSLLASALYAAETKAAQPNIVVFLVDDMGVMDTSVPFLTDDDGNAKTYPLNEYYRTPSMERLAARGIRLNNFYAMSVCSPTRCSIMTGQNAARHRVTNWINPDRNNGGPQGPPDWNWEGLKSTDVTLPRLLSGAGYRTILSSGYYLDHLLPAPRHYLVDPSIPAGAPSSGAVLGGEACQWAEFVTEESIDSRLWPRLAAVAERLWSPAEVRDVDDMMRRLDGISLTLEGVGLRHEIDGILDAPLSVVVTCDPDRGAPHVLGAHAIADTSLYSTCLAVQNLWLAATAEGLGVGWVSFYREEALRELLAIPARVRPVAWLCVGPVTALQEVLDLERHGWRRRRPLDAAVHTDRWGA